MRINASVNLWSSPNITDQQSKIFDLDIKSKSISVDFHDNVLTPTMQSSRCNNSTIICSQPCSRYC